MTSPPESLGLNNGQLAPCPSSPNCVCSQCSAQDAEHYIAPLPFTIPAELLMQKMLEVLRETPRTEVVVASNNYVHAKATTLIMRFTDDFELYIDTSENTLHFRSASRLGYSDLGANRKRVEAFKRRLADKLSATN